MRASWGLTETSRLPPSACVSHFACFVTRTTKDEVKLSIEVCVANDERESATKEEEASIASSPQYWCYCGSTKVGVQSERRCSLFSGRMRLVLPQKGGGEAEASSPVPEEVGANSGESLVGTGLGEGQPLATPSFGWN